MNATPRTMVRQMAVASRARELAVQYGGDRLAYSTSTGQEKPSGCPEVRAYGEHVLSDVIADLPGDRSVGYCQCGEYIDTLTWDERNA